MVPFSIHWLFVEETENDTIVWPDVKAEFAFEVDPKEIIFIAVLVTSPAHIQEALDEFGIKNFWDHIQAHHVTFQIEGNILRMFCRTQHT